MSKAPRNLTLEKPTQPGRYWYDRHDGWQAQCTIVLRHHKKLRKGKVALVVETGGDGDFLLSDINGWKWQQIA